MLHIHVSSYFLLTPVYKSVMVSKITIFTITSLIEIISPNASNHDLIQINSRLLSVSNCLR